MTTTVGIRDIARNSNILQGYDYIHVEDKRTHEYKGLFISPKYADEIKAYLDAKLSKEKQKEIDEIMQFAGILSGETQNKKIQALKAEKKEKYNHE